MTATKLLLVILLLSAGGLGAGLLLRGASGKERPGDQPGRPAAEAPAPEPAPARDGFGPEVNGLRAKITLPRDRFVVGAAVPTSYVVKNVSKAEQTLWHCGFWPNHQVIVKDASGKEPPLTKFGRQCRGAFTPGGPRKGNVAVKVPPGGEDAAYEKYDLSKLYEFTRPGRYTVQYVYEEKQGGWEGRLPSNMVGFTIVGKDPAKDDRAESKPVRVRGLEFVALVPKRIPVPQAGARDIALGLRVTNVADMPTAIAVSDVIRLWVINTVDGTRLRAEIGRDGLPRPRPPVKLAPGESWTWQPRAKLGWTFDRATLRLSGPDGLGVPGFWSITTLKVGKHRLAIEYANGSAKQGDVTLWVGKATTNEVEFDIVR